MIEQIRLDKDYLEALGFDYESMSDDAKEIQLFSLPYYDSRREQINRFKAFVILEKKINNNTFNSNTISSMSRRYPNIKADYLYKIRLEIKSVA